MAKAKFRLPNGTSVEVDGSPEEITKLLDFYGGSTTEKHGTSAGQRKSHSDLPHAKKREPSILDIVQTIKSCDEFEAIEKHILDRTSVVDRTLLPLLIVHKHFGNAFGLTSGDINRVTTELGIPIAAPNIANTLAGSASRYVVGDKLRKKGSAVRYKISHRGLQYLQAVISGGNNGK
jgi:hypothetical protein